MSWRQIVPQVLTALAFFAGALYLFGLAMYLRLAVLHGHVVIFADSLMPYEVALVVPVILFFACEFARRMHVLGKHVLERVSEAGDLNK